jgi:hypothetical protein
MNRICCENGENAKAKSPFQLPASGPESTSCGGHEAVGELGTSCQL